MSAPDRIASGPPSAASQGGTGQVIIRLDKSTRSDQSELLQLARENGFAELEAFLLSNSHLKSERVIRHASPDTIRQREAIAARSTHPPLKSMTTYWRVDVSSEDDPDRFLKVFARMPEIEVAYHETAVFDAGPSVAANTYQSMQTALDAAPQGIDARGAWNLVNGMGQGVQVVDVEAGWIDDHEDLPKFLVLYGDNAFTSDPSAGDHGAAALGVIGALNNDRGVVGIAPYLDALDVCSHYEAATNTNFHVADAIDAATKFLNPGDIIAIEVQRTHNNKMYPVEIDSADLQAIRHATAQGIIVVEAAGNWMSNDLDQWVDPTGEHTLDRTAEGFNDSGAIMVGASGELVVSDPLGFVGHDRYYRSNFGSRLDCYGPGERVCTAGYGMLAGSSGSGDSYTKMFGETSAATAVIAGAAAVVQGWYKRWCGQPLNGPQMRAMLSNPATGTKQTNLNNDPIGVMPNLTKIMTCRRRLAQVLSCLVGRLNRPTLDLGEFEVHKANRPVPGNTASYNHKRGENNASG